MTKTQTRRAIGSFSVLSVLALALGVALGGAVSVVNRSALDEFARGLRTVSGQGRNWSAIRGA